MIRFGTTRGRWILAATVLGSGIAFLDGTVVNVALPSIAQDLHTDVQGLQWVLDAYLVTLTSFLLLGGSLGDRLGRKRVFLVGLVAFTVASVLCALASDALMLSLARALQGAGGAFLVPGSLAILAASFAEQDRGRAVGAWSGLAGIASAGGPFLGGWLIDAWSWRFVFLINVPIAAATFVITVRHVPESHADHPSPIDGQGAALASVGLMTACYALIEGPNGMTAPVVLSGIISIVAIIGFFVVEARSAHPMLPLRLFRSRQFSGANATTLAVYGALGAATFLVVLELQLALGYSALQAGASLLPLTVITLLLSSRMGALSQRIGARIPMTVGPILVGIGMLLFTRIEPGVSYWSTTFPAADRVRARTCHNGGAADRHGARERYPRRARRRVGRQQRGGPPGRPALGRSAARSRGHRHHPGARPADRQRCRRAAHLCRALVRGRGDRVRDDSQAGKGRGGNASQRLAGLQRSLPRRDCVARTGGSSVRPMEFGLFNSACVLPTVRR